MGTAQSIIALSKWIDASSANATRDPEACAWGRVAKVSEEHGEAIQALIGATGQNPRKGFTHRWQDVEDELLDVALTALGAVAHLRGNAGDPLALLEAHVAKVCERAGISA